jgi:hypothetical protein
VVIGDRVSCNGEQPARRMIDLGYALRLDDRAFEDQLHEIVDVRSVMNS